MELLDENGVQVNCSQLLYESNVNLTISVNKQQNVSVTCGNTTQTITFDRLSLDCDKSHIVEAYYYAKENTIECTVSKVIGELPCQGMCALSVHG